MEGCARRVLHAATVNGEATSFPRPIRVQGGCGWTQGRPMTRAQSWEFAAVGLQLEMFCTVLIFRPDDEMPGKHEKIVATTVFRVDEKYRRFDRRHRRVLISREVGREMKNVYDNGTFLLGD